MKNCFSPLSHGGFAGGIWSLWKTFSPFQNVKIHIILGDSSVPSLMHSEIVLLHS